MNVRIIGRSTDADSSAASLAAIDIGNGMGALLCVQVTLTKTTVPINAASVELLAANEFRRAAIIRNDGNTNLHVAEPPNPVTAQAKTGESVVPPAASYDLTEAQQGAIFGWWESPSGVTLSGQASISEIT